ncbi:replicative DNA helicase [Streptomyces sp. NPDC054784]
MADMDGPGDRVALSPQRRNGGSGREQHDRGRESGGWGEGTPFERVPPQDLDAEQSVLGGMLLSKDAIADVVEVLRGHDFYRPAHETVYQAILDLYAKGEPADPITVAAELTKRGDIGRVGGPGYLHSLVQSVPTAANAEYYAEIVHERAVLRRLVEAGTRITQMGYAADGDVDEIVNSAQAEIYAVTEERTSEDYLPLAEIMESALDEIEAIGSRSGQMTGVPTGFTDLDSLTNGLHPGQMVVVAARPAMGKALALDTPLPTPDGWTTMGEVAEGDRLLAHDGTPTRVVAVTGVLTGRPCYEVEFDDGTVVVADADHQWRTETRAERRAAGRTGGASSATASPATAPPVRTTKEIAATLRCVADGRLNHSVRNADPLRLPHRELPVDPYALGAWLGGGTGDATADGPGGDGRFEAHLRALGVLDRRHIPTPYLRAAAGQRRELLAGLLDARGTVGAGGSVRFAVTARALAEDFRELVLGLGHRCAASVRSSGAAAGAARTAGTAGTAYVTTFTPVGDTARGGTGDGGPFRLARKRRAYAARGRPASARASRRLIRDVREVASVPVRCVQVAHPDQTYLATRSLVPTHNSTLALDFARACSIRHNLPSVIFSLEMGRNEIAMRLLSAEARVALHHMRSGSMTDDDWTRLARQMPGVTDAPLYIDDSPNLSMMEIRAKCRRLKQRNDLRLVVIDYLQLMQAGGSRRPESRQQEVSEMSRNLKLLAKELEVPVVALSQLNRGPEQRTDKKPMVSDLRESGCLTARTRVLRADGGGESTLGELLESGARDIPVWSLDADLRLVPRTMTHVFPSGTKEVFRLRLASGREVEATANHPFLTFDGWRPLGALSAGDRLAVPRRVGAPTRAADGVHGVEAYGVEAYAAGDGGLPRTAHGLADGRLRRLLGRLWTAGASGTAPFRCRVPGERRARDLQLLLLRLEIGARLLRPEPAGPDGADASGPWTLDVPGRDDRRRFLAEVGPHLSGTVAAAARRLRTTGPDTRAERETVPADVRDGVRDLLHAPRPEPTLAGARTAPGGSPLAHVSRLLASRDLELLATGDVAWDRVVAVESLGEQPVYDATVPGTHNFVADGVHVHNSIEQDADMVILLHREDAYEKESPRAGEADLIVAKHRNGPTATITVAFQGHYSRFVDMANG